MVHERMSIPTYLLAMSHQNTHLIFAFIACASFIYVARQTCPVFWMQTFQPSCTFICFLYVCWPLIHVSNDFFNGHANKINNRKVLFSLPMLMWTLEGYKKKQRTHLLPTTILVIYEWLITYFIWSAIL